MLTNAATNSDSFPLFFKILVGTSPPVKGRDSKKGYNLVPTTMGKETLRQKEP